MRSKRGDVEGEERIYRFAWDWASRVLPERDSILTPGTKIWTLENLLELEDRFVGHPDDSSDKSFLAKLQEQLSGASPDAVQLMVELHFPFFWWIWEGAISAPRKLSDLNAILSWHPDRPQVPPEIVASLRPGFAHPGTWPMTRRGTQITSVIRASTALQRLPPQEYTALLQDPFAFRDFVLAVPAPSGDAAKLGLLHLVFPDTFEHISSDRHRRLLIERFADLTGGEADPDRALLRIREGLEPIYGDDFSFYSEDVDPLLHLWLKNPKAWDALLRWLGRIWATLDLGGLERNYKLSVAEEFAKGRAALLARESDWYDTLRRGLAHRENNLLGWRRKGDFVRWAKDNPDDAEAALRALWESDPGSSEKSRIDAFADGIRPAGLTTTGAAVNLASGLLMATEPETHPPLTVEMTRKFWRLAGWGNEPANTSPGQFVCRAYVFFDELLRDTSGWERPMRDRLDVQGALWTLGYLSERPDSWTEDEWNDFTAFQGGAQMDDAHETGEEPEDPVEPPDDTAVQTKDFIASAAKDLHVDRAFLDKIVTLLEDKGQVVFYGPPGTGKTYIAKRLARAMVEEDPDRVTVVQFHPATTYEDFFEGLRPRLDEDGAVSYELRRGPLSQMAKDATDNPNHRYVMVIDELNRANLPKVFGELLFLLEYRQEPVATLYRPGEKFELPENLFFIATMNTADRSVALVDAALRRRFHFIPFFPHLGEMKGLLRRWLSDHGRDTAVADLLDAVNSELQGQIGDHLVIGPSHFMKDDLSEGALQRIWEFNIYPTLEELLWGRTEELAAWQWTAVRRRYAAKLRLPNDDDATAEAEAAAGAASATEPEQ
ncbi:McrB family protein [Propionicicella superfundia]|uniref:McrB family protein n=1 Tax=Propionicicella superfundia TaxID=348582 RepID=UPI0004206A84|nr:AAA family ATPase [Propionicicella superfundia]